MISFAKNIKSGALKEEMEQAFEECLEQTSMDLDIMDIEVSWNNRLKTSAGRARQVAWIENCWNIELNPKYYRDFGAQRTLGTFRHELAHIADWLETGYTGHGRNFKRLCTAFGGTMNEKLAADTAGAKSSTEYIQTSAKWQYTCAGCGVSFTTKRRLGKNKEQHGRCKNCGTSIRRWSLKQLR